MKRQRGYFKHFNDASRGDTLAILARKKKYLSICLWWLYLEVANQKNNSGKGSIDLDLLCGMYNIKKKSVVHYNNAISELTDSFEWSIDHFKVHFVFHNYAEYQEKRGKKKKNSNARKVPIKDRDKREIDKTIPDGIGPGGQMVKKVADDAKVDQKKSIAKTSTLGQNTSHAIARYAENWKAVHKGSPPITGADSGILKRLVKDLGLKRVSQLIDAYFQIPDSWAFKRAHDLKTFSSKISELARFVDSGEFVTRETARVTDQEIHHRKQNLDQHKHLQEDQEFLAAFEPEQQTLTGGFE